MNAITAYDLGHDMVIIVDEYHGCDDCQTPVGITLWLFSKEEAERWLFDDQKPSPLRLNETQAEGLSSRSFPFVGRNELVEAAKEIEDQTDIDEYGSMADWLHDKGLRLLQTAMNKRKWIPCFKG